MSGVSTAAITAALRADVPVLLWGAPGVGKTAVLRDLAAAEGAHLEVLIGSTLDPTDLGYQVPDGAGVGLRHVPPAWALRLRAALESEQPCWLLLDELSCAPPSVQAALLRLVHERVLGDCDLSGARVLAAANPAEQGAAAIDLSAAAANRWLHLRWDPDPATWCVGVLDGWGRAPAAERPARALVAAHVRSDPDALLVCPDDPVEAGGAWPSPRSWEALARVLAALGGDARAAALSAEGSTIAEGLVGRAAAGAWTSWVASAAVPDPEDVLAGTASLPERADLAAQCLVAVAVAATAEHAERAWRWQRAWALVEGARRDVALAAARELVQRRPDGAELPPVVVELGDAVRAARRAP